MTDNLNRYIDSHCGKLPKSICRAIKKYAEDNNSNIKESTLKRYVLELVEIFNFLCRNNTKCSPSYIKSEDVLKLIKSLKNGESLHHNTIVWKLGILKRFLNFFNNNAVEDSRFKLKYKERTNARWISPNAMNVILETVNSLAENGNPEFQFIIHLSYDLLLRKSEMLKLKVEDFIIKENGRGHIHIVGKGDKESILPFAPNTLELFERFMAYRAELIKKAKANGDPINLSENYLFIWYRKGIGVSNIKPTTFDNRLFKITELVRQKINDPMWRLGYHDLRRTGAKRYWREGMNLVILMFILRHENIRTTIRYLGLKEDMIEEELTRIWNLMDGDIQCFDLLNALIHDIESLLEWFDKPSSEVMEALHQKILEILKYYKNKIEKLKISRSEKDSIIALSTR